MPTLGIDGEILLDGSAYWIRPGTYKQHVPRVRKATVRLDGAEAYVDLGPGKRVWTAVILCVNDLLKYDGTSTGLTGQQYRDNLYNSYVNNVGVSVLFTPPNNPAAIPVHFDNYLEVVVDVRTQQIALATGGAASLSYIVAIELVEA